MNLARRRTQRVSSLPVLLASVWMISACSSGTAPPEAAPRPVLVMTVGDANQATERRVPAVVVARYASDIGFQAAGRIAKRSVELGQSVRRGQLLMQLDASDYQLASAASQDQVAVARAQSIQASADAKRFVSLVEAGAISVAESERQTARADAANAQYQQAKRQADIARNRLRYASLIAPYDGVVTGLYAEAGQVVGEGVPVVSIAKPGELELAADIPEAMIRGIDKHQAQAEFYDATAPAIALTLREVAPTATQPLRTYRARYALDGVSAKQLATLHLGMTAQVVLSATSTSTAAALLPATALVKARDAVSVWLVKPNASSLIKQPVTVLHYGNDNVLLSGVPAGARVVIAGVQKLDAKMSVRAVERSGAGVNLSAPNTMSARP